MKRKLTTFALCVMLAWIAFLLLERSERNAASQGVPSLVLTQDGRVTLLAPGSRARMSIVSTLPNVETNGEPRAPGPVVR